MLHCSGKHLMTQLKTKAAQASPLSEAGVFPLKVECGSATCLNCLHQNSLSCSLLHYPQVHYSPLKLLRILSCAVNNTSRAHSAVPEPCPCPCPCPWTLRDGGCLQSWGPRSRLTPVNLATPSVIYPLRTLEPPFDMDRYTTIFPLQFPIPK